MNNMNNSPSNSLLHGLSLHDIRVDDPFWSRYTDLVTQRILPYQYQVLHDLLPDTPQSHCIRNFRIAAGLEEGEFRGWVFQDTDLAKWLEAAAFTLNYTPDPALEQQATELIALVGKAQQENGYLNTYFSILHPGKQYCNLKEGHELYTAGHFIEAAVAWYEATGHEDLLNIMRRCADHICRVFQTEEYADAVPGHEEIELALMKLSRVTGERKYAKMALAFLDRRGCSDYLSRESSLPRFVDVWHDPNPYEPCYGQAHLPVRQQSVAEGHAVRALYLYSGMADAAGYFGDPQLLDACRRLYENITRRRMYITGGVGSSGILERFTADYDLPNDTAYSESCAAIALAMFCRRMASVTGEAHYMDTAERALINTALAGVSLDGEKFFYVNPLEVVPDRCRNATDKQHVKPRRQSWFGCACCPPNIARTLASLGCYAYSCDGETLWVDLYIGGSCKAELSNGTVTVRQTTGLPYAGWAQLEVEACASGGKLLLRIPGYGKNAVITVNGRRISPTVEKGYAHIPITAGQTAIRLEMQMPPRLFFADPHVSADSGKCAVLKGNMVYCLEETDNGDDLAALVIDADGPLNEEFDQALGANVILARGWRCRNGDPKDSLYTTHRPVKEPATLRFVPYCFWGNRSPGEMAVWVRYSL